MENLVYNRTAEDVSAAKEIIKRIASGTASAEDVSAFLSGLKGAYTAEDMNRVGAAYADASAMLGDVGISAPVLAKTDWSENDMQFEGDWDARFSEYIQNIKTVRAAIGFFPNTPEAPDDVANFKDANDIEKILYDFFILHSRIGKSSKECGSANAICGLNGGLLI